MSDDLSQNEELLSRFKEAKRQEWERLVQLEAAGFIPEGESIVSIHDEFCAHVDAMWNDFVRQDKANEERYRQQLKDEDQKLKEDQKLYEGALSAMYDLAIDHYLQDKSQQT